MGREIGRRVDIGHVHLKVADLDRSVAFYRDVLGFEVTQRMGDSAAFLSAGGYHHHIGLNTWESAAAPRRRRGPPGCITSRSAIPIAPRSAMRCGGSTMRGFHSTARAITA